MSAPRHPSPYALGWARALALTNAPPGLSLRELFDRQLFIGLTLAAAITGASSGIPSLFSGFWLDVGASAAYAGTLLALLIAFVASSGRLTLFAHVLVAQIFLIPAGSPLFVDQDLGWLMLIWTLPCLVVATLLTGMRGGMAWTAATLGATLLNLAAPRLGLPLDHGVDVRPFVGPTQLAFSFGLLACFLLVALGWFIQQRSIMEDLLAEERARAQALLRDVLPEPIALRLEQGEVIADALDEVTVVFADLVGFTTLAAGIPARRVVGMLSELFGELDRIASEEGVEKVKTIGDCYMAVVGAPLHVPDHADRALRFARRVQAALQGRACFGHPLQLRIGVHSGPVMAGILGRKRILYDLWGDTVNVAARLESSGVPGEVQVSEATLRLCQDPWPVTDRGLVQLKGRSGMRCFLLGEEGSPGSDRVTA